MMDRPGGRILSYRVAALLSVLSTLLFIAAPSPADEPQYISEDARITGKVIHTFSDNGQDVVVALGGFTIEVGKRTLSGDQAVVWITQKKLGKVVRRDLTVYIKGNARVVEVNGSVSSDKTMLVTIHQEGRLIALGQMSDQSLIDDPLYTEALAIRGGGKPAPAAPLPTFLPVRLAAGQPGSEPVSIASMAPSSGPTTEPAEEALTEPTTQPALTEGVAATTQPASAPAIAARKPTTKPAMPKEPQDVTFRPGENFSVEETGPNQHVIIATDVYLSQGNSDSDNFLQMQAEGAALFTEPADKKAAPHAPKLVGMPGKPGSLGEKIVGVYLEGDVRITRGDRTMRAKAVYYDWVNDRAVILDPVFRTVQEQRNIPVYIRAKLAYQLSANEMLFKDAKLTSSDFASPETHIGASSVYLKDVTEYDEQGMQITPKKYEATIKDETFNIYSVPILYWPESKMDVNNETSSSIRRLGIGKQNGFGNGVQTEWDLFRLLGLLRPEGFKGTLDAEGYTKGVLGAVNLDYARVMANRQFSGYDKFVGVIDNKHSDTFGQDVQDVPAPTDRYWVEMRHKELLPQKDLELQFELSFMSDQNFLRKFYPNEYSAGKEQETLIYAKKQRDNWAIDTLLDVRLNDFQTQTESYPDFSFHWLGEPLAGDALSFYNEDNLGIKRFAQGDNDDQIQPTDGGQIYNLGDSNVMGRANTRNELDAPLHAGPLNLVPYVVGQATYWSDSIDGGSEARPFGEAGLKANTHIQRVFSDANSRLFDVNQLRHIITPQAVAFFSTDGGVDPDDLFPLDPGIEDHVGKINGGSLGLYQRLQTKRGPEGNQHTVDWMTLNITAMFVTSDIQGPPADGRFFLSRPEYSIPRSAVDTEYNWNISDATSFLSYLNYDDKSGKVGTADAGFAVSRDPRVRYYIGWRYIGDLNSSVGTFGVNYKLNDKYSISVFEQYDFEFNNGENLGSNISLIRKFPRWYCAVTFQFDRRTDDSAVLFTVWPEGIPEFHLGGERTSLLGVSSNN